MVPSQKLNMKQAFALAELAVKKGNVVDALHLYNTILKQFPQHPQATRKLRELKKDPPQDQMNLMMHLIRSNRPDQAEHIGAALLRQFPASVNLFNLLGAALQRQKKLEQAAQIFDQAIAVAPNYAPAYYNRGNILKELELPKKALESYDRAIELKPDFIDAYTNRGVLLNEMGQSEKAVESYDRAVLLTPHSAVAYYNRGTALADSGLVDKAAADYKKAISLDPRLAKAHYNLSAMKRYRTGDSQIGLMEQIVSNQNVSTPDRMRIGFALGKAYEDIGEYDKSFYYYNLGNRLRKSTLIHDIKNTDAKIKKLKKIFKEFS
ncbi:MAG: tetratricopeptide repeat protein, partial [Desulfobacterales bacterium]|nr:tetratricopeptide repeat protein [Desulfobacterales bacterium]